MYCKYCTELSILKTLLFVCYCDEQTKLLGFEKLFFLTLLASGRRVAEYEGSVDLTAGALPRCISQACSSGLPHL